MATGERLWFLYHPDQYCNIDETLSKNLPKRCPRIEGRCIEGLHPLDVAQHYFELRELGLAPLLHLQLPGEIFCFPRHWYHGTLNLEPTVAVALTLNREGGPTFCPGDEPEIYGSSENVVGHGDNEDSGGELSFAQCWLPPPWE